MATQVLVWLHRGGWHRSKSKGVYACKGCSLLWAFCAVENQTFAGREQHAEDLFVSEDLVYRLNCSLSCNVPLFLSYNPVYPVLVLFVLWPPYCCLRKGWRLLYCRFPCGHFLVLLGSDFKNNCIRYSENYVKCLCAYLLLKLWLFGIIWSSSWDYWNNSQILRSTAVIPQRCATEVYTLSCLCSLSILKINKVVSREVLKGSRGT